MDVNTVRLACAARAAPTELERLWYCMLGGLEGAAEAFFEEVQIADLRGPGHLPVDHD